MTWIMNCLIFLQNSESFFKTHVNNSFRIKKICIKQLQEKEWTMNFVIWSKMHRLLDIITYQVIVTISIIHQFC